MALHKILTRLEERREASKQSHGDLLLFNDAAFEKYVMELLSGRINIQALVIFLRAKLHRSLPPHELLWISQRLVDLLNKVPSIQDDLVFLCSGFPELLVCVAQTALLDQSDASLNFLCSGLGEWIPLGHFSSTLSHVDVVRHMSNVICAIGHQRPQEAVHLMTALIPRLYVGKQDDLLVAISILSQILETLLSLQLGGNIALGLALVDFIFRCKSREASFDCTFMLRLLHRIGCPLHPLCSLVFTHPMFDEKEMIAGLATGSNTGHPFTKTSALFVLADYPYLLSEHEMVLQDILTTECSSSPSSLILDQVKVLPLHKFILLLSSLLAEDRLPNMAFDDFSSDFDLAYIAYIWAADGIRVNPSTLSIQTIVRITAAYPLLAQRTLFLLSFSLKQCPSRPVLLEVLSGLMAVSSIDDFCREKALSLLSVIAKSSYEMRCFSVPLLAQHVKEYPHLFNLVCEHLPPLLFSSNARSEGARAYSISIFRLVRSSNRQSHLKFVFAAIQNLLQSAGKAHDLGEHSLALLVLICDLLVWREFVRPLALKYVSSHDLNAECCEIVGLFSRMIPDHEEDYEATDEIVTEGIDFLCSNLHSFPAASLLALSHFPMPFLRYRQVDIPVLFLQSLSCMGNTRIESESSVWESFLAEWVQADVQGMPRSLFLGTSAASSTVKQDSHRSGCATDSRCKELISSKCSSANNNPIFSVIKLSQLDGDIEPFKTLFCQFTALPSLSLQHWFLRIYFVDQLRRTLDVRLSAIDDAESFDSLVESLSSCLRERMSSAQTVACLSYAILQWCLLMAAATLNDSNQNRSLEAIQLMLSGKAYNVRFAVNDEVLSALIFGLYHLLTSFNDHEHRQAAKSLIQGFLASLASPRDTWLWFSKEYCFGMSRFWPTLLRDSSQSCPVEDSFSADIWTLLSASCEADFASCYAKSLQMVDPVAFSGISLFALGRKFGGAKSTKVWIEENVKTLAEPGPAVRKLGACYALAGVLQASTVDFDLVISIQNALTNVIIDGCTDQRLMTWLILILKDTTTKLESMWDGNGSKIDTRRKVYNRFGPESALGTCLDILDDDTIIQHVKDTVLRGITRTTQLPRLDWASTCRHLEESPAFVGFALKHFVSEYNNQSLINKSILEHLICSFEGHGDQVALIPTRKLVELLKAALVDQSLFERLVACTMAANTKRERTALLVDLLGLDLSRCEESFWHQILPSCLQSNDPVLWQCISRLIPGPLGIPSSVRKIAALIPPQPDSDWQYSAVISLIVKEPHRIPLFSSLLQTNQQAIQDLSSLLLLNLDDSPELVPTISSLILAILEHRCKGLMSLIHDPSMRAIVAWRYFVEKEPASAEKLGKRLRKIAPLLETRNPLNYILGSL